MSEINASNFKKEHGDLAPDLVGVTELTSPYFFVPPSGTTAERPEDCEPGTLRFNTDHGSLEIFRGKTIGWEQIQKRESQYLGGGTGSNAGTGTRMLTAGGFGSPSDTDVIQFTTISTLGNSQDFGDLNEDLYSSAACSSRTRFVALGGYHAPSNIRNTIQFNTFASLGNAQDFGDMLDTHYALEALSSETRGVFTFGSTPVANTLEYITIASTGNSVDFADSTEGRKNLASCASSTRGLFVGGRNSGNTITANIDQITINTQANAVDFGDLATARAFMSGFSNSTRGLFASGKTPSGFTNIIEQVTIATQGNATDFGGDTTNAFNYTSAGSSSTRGVIAGGNNDTPSSDTYYNVIQKVEILSSGNAVDFGDLLATISSSASASNGHGGL